MLQVYDVTAGKQFYGRNAPYSGFAGRDASRSFLTMCFTEECLTNAHDLSGLSPQEMQVIDDWAIFFDEEHLYPFVGYVK